jgi:hypothetical protein
LSPSSTESYFTRPGGDDAQSWHWRCHDASGAETAPATSGTGGFPSQADAESWLGEVWRDLLEEGVESVTLLEGEREVYGPMSLRA